jgi:site-specific recombinase XerD
MTASIKGSISAGKDVKAVFSSYMRLQCCPHLLETGYGIRTLLELLGHQKLQTTMIYTHVASKNILGVRSPLDK